MSALIVVATIAPGGTTAATGSRSLLISPARLRTLPTSGPAWAALKSYADRGFVPKISDQENQADVEALAEALVFARTGRTAYRTAAYAKIRSAIGTESGGRTLALARNLSGYVLAADLIRLPAYAPTFNSQTFRPWLRRVLSKQMADGRNLIQMHNQQGNNWGTHAAAALAAAYGYLGDRAGLDHTARVVRGFLGNTAAWYGWRYHQDLQWACGTKPAPIDASGCSKRGHSVDGVLQQDQTRGCDFVWPPCRENYAWEALQGLTLAAELLTRRGHDVWRWSDRAILRSVRWLHYQARFPAVGDDTSTPWIINARYGSRFPTVTPTRPGKNFGFADWLFG